jgi:hypothetical protein
VLEIFSVRERNRRMKHVKRVKWLKGEKLEELEDVLSYLDRESECDKLNSN